MPLLLPRLAFAVPLSPASPLFINSTERVQTMEEALRACGNDRENVYKKSETKASRNGKRKSPDLGTVSSEHHNNKETQVIIGHHYCHRRISLSCKTCARRRRDNIQKRDRDVVRFPHSSHWNTRNAIPSGDCLVKSTELEATAKKKKVKRSRVGKRAHETGENP